MTNSVIEIQPLQVLRDCKVQLSNLVTNNFMDLCQVLVAVKVITKDKYKFFCSLNPKTVKCRLKMKFLLQCIIEHAETDIGIVKKFQDALKVCQMLSAYNFLDNRLSGKSANVEDEMTKFGDNYVFTANEVQIILTEIMGEIAYKWEQMAIALHLPRHIFEECRYREHQLAMFLVLCKWGGRKGGPPTWGFLKKALCGRVVAESHFAENLPNEFVKAKMKAQEDVENYNRADISINVDITVKDRMSTLMEVYTCPADPVTFKWIKDDVILRNNKFYCNVNTSILAINNACQGLQGKYKCIIKDKHQEYECEYDLSIEFSRQKRHLLDTYLQSGGISKKKLPYGYINEYIDLDIVEKCSHIAYETTKKYYKDVFRVYKPGKLIFIEGHAGAGKSVLVNKIAMDWASGQDILANAQMVFLIDLSTVSFKITKLCQLLSALFSEDLASNITDDIMKVEGDGSCFILDGFDLYNFCNEVNESYVYALLFRNCPRAMIIISSRSVDIAKFPIVYQIKHIEVVGFESQKQIFDCIYSIVSQTLKDEEKTKEESLALEKYVKFNPDILEICKLPWCTAIITHLYLNQRKEIDQYTVTEIYHKITTIIVADELVHKHYLRTLDSLSDLSEKARNHFVKICSFAFQKTLDLSSPRHTGIMNQFTQAFVALQKSVAAFYSEKDKADSNSRFSQSFGLFSVHHKVSMNGFSKESFFLSISLQDFLAALHIKYQRKNDQNKILKQYCADRRMRRVVSFYCGSTEFESNDERLNMVLKVNSDQFEHLRSPYHSGYSGGLSIHEDKSIENNVLKGRCSSLKNLLHRMIQKMNLLVCIFIVGLFVSYICYTWIH